ncbi:MAG: hypothetical protein HY671_05260 [Chloroflexi bacterium]|nr:hypothetical protein [Chloroflexota bacterium]
MSVRVGIPRALLYYQYFPMWKTFFETLGAETVVSHTTTKAVLADGASRMVAETCLPVKVFCGHAAALAKDCDYLFIPSIRSMQPRVFNCSKFLALPDMIKATVPEAPPILDTEVDVNQGQRGLCLSVYSLARHFTWNPLRARKATERALEAHRKYRRMMWQKKLGPPQAIAEMDNTAATEARHAASGLRLKVALVGHPYLIYDDFVNHRLAHRLEALGAEVYTPEMASPRELDAAVSKVEERAYWTYESEVVGAAGYYMEKDVDGIIGLASFGCGPDSLMTDVVEHYGRQRRAKPFMCLTIDEHSGEAGLLTRLEAFLDMLARGKRR